MQVKTQFDHKVIAAGRANLGINRDELAFRMRLAGAKVSVSTLRNWERGTTAPDAHYMPFLASALECDVTAFFVPMLAKANEERN